MGIDYVTFNQICKFAARQDQNAMNKSLMLGRAKLRYYSGKRQFHIPYKAKFQKSLDDNGFDLEMGQVIQKDNYAEKMFRKLGLGSIETMDYSDYEFSDNPEFTGHLHDLSEPVPKKLHNQYNFIFDGGTLEHVFNVPVALENVFDMLKDGGRFIGVNPLNGWPGHGMYQFSPELIYSFWNRKCGCEVTNCFAMSERPGKYFKHMKDPNNLTGRSRIGRRMLLWRVIPRGRLYLYYEIKKLADNLSTKPIMQTSYLKRWGEGK